MFAALVCMTVLAGVMGCEREAEDVAAPVVQEQLPPLELRDDTSDVLLTWIDYKGDYHVVQHVKDVPEEGRKMVRVTTPTAGHGEVLYVADLTRKKQDGTYSVTSQPRSAWTFIADARRVHTEKQMAPAEPVSPSPPAAAATAQELVVIVYGTQWCGACKAARSYFHRNGIKMVDKDVSRDDAAGQEMVEKLVKAGYSAKSGIPVIDVHGQIFVGFDSRKLDAAVRRAKSRMKV